MSEETGADIPVDVDTGGDTGETTTEPNIDLGSDGDSGGADAEYRAAMKAAGVKLMDDPDNEDIPDVDKMEADEREKSSLDKTTTEVSKEKAETEPDEPKAITSEETETLTPEQETDLKDAFEMTLKVGDDEKTYTSMEEIQKLAQHGLGANSKMQEAAQMRKEAENFIQSLKDDPFKALGNESLGLNVRDLAEQYLYNQLEMDAMTPEQRQQKTDNEELARRRTHEADTKEARETQTKQDEQSKYRTEFTTKIKESLDGSGIPVTDWTIARMAGYMRQAVSKGLDSSPANLIQFVRQDWIKSNRDFFGQIGDTEELISVLGDDTMTRIRKHQVAKYKAGTQKPANVVQNAEPRAAQKKAYSSVEEMREDMLG